MPAFERLIGKRHGVTGLTFVRRTHFSDIWRGRIGAAPVGIKHLAVSDPSMTARFVRELAILQQAAPLGCASQPLASGQYSERPYFIAPWEAGEPLGATIGLATDAPSVGCTRLIATLARLHDAGIVHRDISPEHIFRCADGSLRLIDFGMAKMRRDVPPQKWPLYCNYDIQAAILVHIEIWLGVRKFAYRKDALSGQIASCLSLAQSADAAGSFLAGWAEMLDQPSEFHNPLRSVVSSGVMGELV